jgi:hypothetical protein
MVKALKYRKPLLFLGFMALILSAGSIQALAEVEVPFESLWSGSGHAHSEAEAFVHWDGDGEVPTRCAKCHSTAGYRDFLGADGTAFGSVENPVSLHDPNNIPNNISCVACHNDVAAHLEEVTFPSGETVANLGEEARCMECHQGRSSKVDVDDAITDAGVDDDTVSGSLRFLNIHYYAAAATLYGTEAKGGYEFAGKAYDHKFAHVDDIDSCARCHNEHSLELELDKCAECHTGVTTAEDTKDIRTKGSTTDHDGDGNRLEGMFYEIEALKDVLYDEMRDYSRDVAGMPITYDSHSYPYFFADPNDNDIVDEGEGRYSTFTPNLLRAAYNYQVCQKDPGGFAHNGKYLIQLLYDTIEALNPSAIADLTRDDSAHFAGSTEAFRHWDEDGHVSASCSKCHSADGLPTFLAEGVNLVQPIANGFKCTTCHDSLTDYTLHEVEEVEFPSGAMVAFSEDNDQKANLCLNCHQGRQSTVHVNDKVAGRPEDVPSSSLSFSNVHYLPAGATVFGTEAKGGFEYQGKVYNGFFEHHEDNNSCTDCHLSHQLGVKVDCGLCHGSSQSDPKDVRGLDKTDFDGDGDTDEGLYYEIETLKEKLYEAMQTYAINAGTPIAYDSHSYPYFFVADNEGNSTGTRYRAFTPRLLKAAYNYQYSMKDPGSFAHNAKYMIQVLHDSIADIGNASSLARPEGNSDPECGDIGFPFPIGDLTEDCIVDMFDLGVLASHWLDDNNPQP